MPMWHCKVALQTMGLIMCLKNQLRSDALSLQLGAQQQMMEPLAR